MLSYNNKEAFTQVLEILKFASEYEKNKIPKKMIQFLEDNKLDNYNFKLNSKDDLKKVQISKDTKGLLSIIYYNYLCENLEEKNEFIKILEDNNEKYSYNKYNHYFNNNKYEKSDFNEVKKDLQLIEKKDNYLLKFIKWLFKIK